MKKIISVLLTVAILFCLVIPAFAEEPETKNYVVLGDSIALGFGVYNRDEAAYGKIVADTAGYNYKNYAVNGFRSQDLLELLYKEEVADSVAQADVISVSVGGNDYLQQNLFVLFVYLLIGNNTHLDNIERNYRENLELIVARIYELNPDVTLLMQTLYAPYIPAIGDFYSVASKRINKEIYSYLDENPDSYYVVDTYNDFMYHPNYIAVDTIHPSAVGNVKIAEETLEVLYEIGLSDTKEPVINAIGIDELPMMSYVTSIPFYIIDLAVDAVTD